MATVITKMNVSDMNVLYTDLENAFDWYNVTEYNANGTYFYPDESENYYLKLTSSGLYAYSVVTNSFSTVVIETNGAVSYQLITSSSGDFMLRINADSSIPTGETGHLRLIVCKCKSDLTNEERACLVIPSYFTAGNSNLFYVVKKIYDGIVDTNNEFDMGVNVNAVHTLTMPISGFYSNFVAKTALMTRVGQQAVAGNVLYGGKKYYALAGLMILDE